MNKRDLDLAIQNVFFLWAIILRNDNAIQGLSRFHLKNEHNAGACIIQYIIQWLKSVLEFLI